MGKHKLSDWTFILFKHGKHPEVIPNSWMSLDKIEEYFAPGE